MARQLEAEEDESMKRNVELSKRKPSAPVPRERTATASKLERDFKLPVRKYTFGGTSEINHFFLVRTPDRDLWLSAADEAEKSEWINAFALALQNVNSKNIVVEPQVHEQWEIDFELLNIQSKVGDGAFGEVFRGRLWGTDVAIKKLKSEQLTPQILQELKQEIAILSTLRHPNVLLYIGACTKPPNICIVTEWCGKGSLYEYLHSDAFISVRQILQLAMGIAQGVNYLHSLEHRIIHRDLKSHNVLLDMTCNTKIADFGLSDMKKKTGSNSTRGVFGTPEWY